MLINQPYLVCERRPFWSQTQMGKILKSDASEYKLFVWPGRNDVNRGQQVISEQRGYSRILHSSFGQTALCVTEMAKEKTGSWSSILKVCLTSRFVQMNQRRRQLVVVLVRRLNAGQLRWRGSLTQSICVLTWSGSTWLHDPCASRGQEMWPFPVPPYNMAFKETAMATFQ